MLNPLGIACATTVMLAATMGCGSYSAPNDSENRPTAPDSAGDTTPAPPPPDYLVR
jgi:hypothetical protein